MRPLVIVCAVVVSACATQNRQFSMGQLRERGGACAGDSGGIADYVITACLRTGAPGTLDDDAVPRVIVHLSGSRPVYADPGSWQIRIFRDGKLLRKERLEHSVPRLDGCTQYGCTHRDVAVLRADEPWAPGLYQFDFTFAADTRIVLRSSVRLVGASPAAAAQAAPP